MSSIAGKKRSVGEGHVRRRTDGSVEVRLYVPVKLCPLYNGQREISFYGRTEDEALDKRTAAKTGDISSPFLPKLD